MLIAVPSDHPGGLDAELSAHFGHCAAFTLVSVADGAVGEVEVLANSAHQQGGCMAPVMLLKEQGVDVLLAGGMGMRPLAGFQQVGIAVHFTENARSVREVVELFLAGGCRAFGEAETCGGGGGACGGHHPEPVRREPIEGRADVRDGRVVTCAYEIRDSSGVLLDSSAEGDALRYVHGAGQLLPALERALAGHEPGDRVVVEVPCGEAFGERDEDRVMRVPRARLPEGVKVGDVLGGEDPHGHRVSLAVVELGDEVARLDGNHPFAGKDLVFEVTVLAVESATPEEMAHGHAH